MRIPYTFLLLLLCISGIYSNPIHNHPRPANTNRIKRDVDYDTENIYFSTLSGLPGISINTHCLRQTQAMTASNPVTFPVLDMDPLLDYPDTICTVPVSIDPPGPIIMGNSQSLTFDAGSGFSSYSWLTYGTPRTIHFSFSNIPARSELVLYEGYLPLLDSIDGTVYTTDGRLAIDSTGKIVHQATGYAFLVAEMENYPLLPLYIPDHTDSIIITATGLVQVLLHDSMNYTQIGQIYQAKFINWLALETIGENLYQTAVHSPFPMIVLPEPQINHPGWTKEESTQTISFSGSNLVYDQLNLFIDGQGYFQLQSPDGTTVFTRDGAFTINELGEVIHKYSQDKLSQNINIPPDCKFLRISPEGNFYIVTTGSEFPVGHIELAYFEHPELMDSIDVGIYQSNIGSGPANNAIPGSSGTGLLGHYFFITVTVADSIGCKGTSTVMVTQLPYPMTPECATVSVTPSGPVSLCEGQSISLEADAGFSSYSWLTYGTPKTVNFTLLNIPSRIDLVLNEGFLPLQNANGEPVYTTDGRFIIDASGKFVHYTSGYPLIMSTTLWGPFEPITIPQNTDSIRVTVDGVVLALLHDSSSYIQIAQLYKAMFSNWKELTEIGEYLYQTNINSAMPVMAVPEQAVAYSGWSIEENTRAISFPCSKLVYDQLNLSISGAGYFQLSVPTGETVYTRDGGFVINNLGQIIHKASGYLLFPVMTIPNNSNFMNISADGIVKVTVGGSEMQIDQIALAYFPFPDLLDSIGNGLYMETPGSESPQTDYPGNSGLGLLIHNYNVTVTVMSPNGCKGTATVQVNEYPSAPQPVITSLSGNTSFCYGDSTTLDAGSYPGPGQITYLWNTGDTTEQIRVGTTNQYKVSITNPFGCSSADSIFIKVFATGTWIGVSDTDWFNTSNWCGGVPTDSSRVIIPDESTTLYSPYLSGYSAIKNLTVNPSGNLIINDNGQLTVNGTIENNGGVYGLIIRSTDNGSGSLLHNTPDVNATAQCFIPNLDTIYHFVSSPVSNALSDVFHYASLYAWNEPGQIWDNIVLLDVPVIPMQGYSMVLYNDQTGNPNHPPRNPLLFRGMLNNGTIGAEDNITNTEGADSTLDGYNLVGNPYPSAIDWDASEGWTKTNINNAIYFFKELQYASYVNNIEINGGSRYIPAHQGFFIRKNQLSFGTGTLIMDNRVRLHNTSTIYKSLNPNTLRLKVVGNNYSDETAVCFDQAATNGYDDNFDAYKMFGYPEVPQLYTRLNDGSLTSINTLSALSDSISVPLLLKTGKNGTYVITASQINSFTNNAAIILEDKKERTMQLLNTNPVYSFSSDTSDVSDRFLLRFYLNPLKINDNNSMEPMVFSFNKTIFVNPNANNSGNATITLFNIRGEELLRREIRGGELNTIETNYSTGCYLVRVQTGNTILVKKVNLM